MPPKRKDSLMVKRLSVSQEMRFESSTSSKPVMVNIKV